MYTESIRLTDGWLAGKWHHSNGSKRRLIVLCHGYQSFGDAPIIMALVKGLNENKQDTFTFNFSANTGGFDIESQVNDIMRVAEYFKDYKEIILLASSFGALPAAIATAHSRAIRGLVTANGFFGKGQLSKSYRRQYVFFRIAALVSPKYRKILKYLRRELRPEYVSVPVLAVHSRADKVVFIRQSQYFYDELISPKQFIELQAANHGIASPDDRKTVVTKINRWLAALGRETAPVV